MKSSGSWQEIVETYGVDGYVPTIGIECHVQLKTKTKLFAGVDNDARQAEPNTLISHICMGLPGALPVLNEEAIVLATQAAFALGVPPQTFSKFDRKHYFYPDLPMGYQITQYDQPIIIGGSVAANVNGQSKKFAVTRAHLEADAGKSTHPVGADYSLVDLNRAGTPLLEIVSEPTMHSAEEAKAYARELYLLMKYAGVSDVNLFYGNMRFDVNVSVSKDPKRLGTRTETKNLNSFRNVHDAVEFEIKRQIKLVESGEQIIQETRGWADDKRKTFSQRGKEDAHDYRYFPDPDLPPVVLSKDFITKIKNAMPPLPDELRQKFCDVVHDAATIETIIDEPLAATLLSKVVDGGDKVLGRTIANWLAGPVQKLVAESTVSWQQVYDAKTQLEALALLIHDQKVSSSAAKEILPECIATQKDPRRLAQEKNLLQESNKSVLIDVVKKIIAEHPKASEDIKNGEVKAIGFLVGQVMKASGGKANPSIVQTLIKRQLGVGN